jgi:hypothetical protein
MKAIKQIREILTSDQSEKVPQVIADVRGIGPAGLPMPVLEKLDLSKGQWSKIHAILVKNRPSQDEQGGPGPGGRPDFRAIHDQVFAVLTDDQKKTASEFQQRRGPGGPGFGGPGGPPPGGPGGPPPGDGDGR